MMKRIASMSIVVPLLAGISALPVPARATNQEAGPASTSHSAEETRNLAAVRAGFDAWSKGTGSPYDLLADDVSWTIVGRSDASKTYPSRAAFMEQVIRLFNARMREPLRPTIHRMVADGDTVVIFFDASGVARDGVPYTNTYAWIWQMRGGKVTTAHAFFDSIAFNELWRRVKP